MTGLYDTNGNPTAKFYAAFPNWGKPLSERAIAALYAEQNRADDLERKDQREDPRYR